MKEVLKPILTVVKVVLNIVLTVLIVGISALVILTMLTNKNQGKIFVASSYIVQSNSMEPTFEAGALIVSVAIKPENIKKRDIITFRPAAYPETNVTHRVIDIVEEEGQIKFMTQGDANNVVDKNLVDQDNLVGKTILWIPSFGIILNDMRNPFFIIVAFILMALLFSIQFLVKDEKN